MRISLAHEFFMQEVNSVNQAREVELKSHIAEHFFPFVFHVCMGGKKGSGSLP